MNNGGCLMRFTLFIIFRWCTIEPFWDKNVQQH